MVDTLIEKYNLGSESTDGREDFELDDRPVDYVAYRIDPQARPANALLDFWKSDGDQRSFAYSHLYDVEFKRSEGIILTFSEHQITVRGRRLDKIYQGLKRHRVVFVWEASTQEEFTAEEEATIVSEIDIRLRPQPQA
ncbi:MAG: hypothetical protein KDB27_30340 [Planctomycetales bacterium]|nr:hypothetical protein [Planctomycetales bacterium]